MALEVKGISRVFFLTVSNQKIKLEDPNPALPVEDIKDLYVNQYPELLNSTIQNNGLDNDELVYEFKTVAGTKG